jgi:hypothetical protein
MAAYDARDIERDGPIISRAVLGRLHHRMNNNCRIEALRKDGHTAKHRSILT